MNYDYELTQEEVKDLLDYIAALAYKDEADVLAALRLEPRLPDVIHLPYCPHPSN